MKTTSSLLNRVKSKYILQNILSLAYKDIKSVIKLIKYNKSMMSIFNIILKNFDENCKYERTIIKDREAININYYIIIRDIILLIQLFIYLICFYIRGTINQIKLEEGFDKGKKKLIDIMDKYILLLYIIYIIISNTINQLLIRYDKIFITGKIKWIFIFINSFIQLVYFIFHIIKFIYEEDISGINIGIALEDTKHYWFYISDLVIIFSYSFVFCLISGYILQLSPHHHLDYYDDLSWLYQFQGINIIRFYLPTEFENFDKTKKYKFLFNNNNIKKYEYELNESQINLINKINDIRKKYEIPLLKYNKVDKLPEFIINEKTQLIFYKFKNLYKLNPNSYIFKYPSQKFIDLLNNDEILNIITISILDRINVIEKENLEFIHVYSDKPIPIILHKNIPDNTIEPLNSKNDILKINRNISIININNSRNKVKINEVEKDIASSKDKLEKKSENDLISAFDIDEESEIKIIKKINFE